MKHPIYNLDLLCPKCGFPTPQMPRQLFSGPHKTMEDQEVVICNIKYEHLHFECCCGYEMVFRPLEEGIKLMVAKAKKSKAKKSKAKINPKVKS